MRYNIVFEYEGKPLRKEGELDTPRYLQLSATIVTERGKVIYNLPFEEHLTPKEIVAKLREDAAYDKENGLKEYAERNLQIADQIEKGDLGGDLPGPPDEMFD